MSENAITPCTRDNKFPKGVKVRNAKTNQGIKEVFYGIMGWSEELLNRRKLDYVKDREKGIFSDAYSLLKEGVKKILR